jgi:hypothetical protein
LTRRFYDAARPRAQWGAKRRHHPSDRSGVPTFSILTFEPVASTRLLDPPCSNPHSARGAPDCPNPRFPPLEVFVRRPPQCVAPPSWAGIRKPSQYFTIINLHNTFTITFTIADKHRLITSKSAEYRWQLLCRQLLWPEALRYILRIIGAPVMGSVERIAIDCAARSPSILFPFYLQLMVPAARGCCGRAADVCSARDGVRWLTWARPRRSPPARKCMVRMNRSRRPIGFRPKGARTSGAR